MDAEPARTGRDPAVRFYDLVAAADIEIVNQHAVLDVEAVARGRIAMRDQHPLRIALADLDMGFDGVAAPPHVGCYGVRHVPQAGVQGELVARAVEPGAEFGKP